MKQSGILTIDRAALADNYQFLQEKVAPHCAVGASVKANAYGLGIKPVIETLNTLKCPQYFVATLQEALEIRQIVPKTSIATLNGLFLGDEEEYLTHNITPILNSIEEIARWQKLAKSKEQALPAFLHINTAMNRQGISLTETQKIIDEPSITHGIHFETVMSHFACADEKDHPLNAQQAKLFEQYSHHFTQSKRSLANSSGIFRDPAYHYDMVRPGYALYGGNPTPETKNPIKRVLGLEVPVLHTRFCKKGDAIGYGASYLFDKDTITATIALGYADGFFRTGSNKAVLYYKGQPCPVIGRVSMDLVTIDIDHLAQKPQVGDTIEILGHHQTIDDLAKATGTIGYEIMTAFGNRYHREYL